MRHETCLKCLHPHPDLAGILPGIQIAEAVGPYVHHHHKMLCINCGAWWFDDLYQRPGLDRILELDLRDTEWCDCPEDAEYYRPAVVTIMEPDAACRCTQALHNSLPHLDLLDLGEQG